MKLLSIQNSKSIWIFPTNDLNPIGARSDGLMENLRDRYKFEITPSPVQLHELVMKKQGVQLSMGAFDWSGGTAAIALTYYADGLMAETRAGTQAGDEFLSDLLDWLKITYGMTDARSMPIRKIYSSEVYVSMLHSLSMFNPKLQDFADLVASKTMPSNLTLAFEVTGITFGANPVAKAQHPNFRLERDVQAPFEDFRYFSVGPLSTEDHLALLQQLEVVLKA